MSKTDKVLIVDDHIGDLRWLLDQISRLGYVSVVATNEADAQSRLEAVASGSETYALAIIDVMMAIKDLGDLMEMAELPESFFPESRSSGIRLCQYARNKLKISRQALPIACLTVRSDDDEVKDAMRKLRVPLFNRIATGQSDSIRKYIADNLPDISSGSDKDR